MVGKGQASLEYLMAYAWALVLVAAIVGVLVFIASPPASQTIFSSSGPTRILIKGGALEGTSVKISAQNITGGKITITGLSGLGGNCTINAQPIGAGLSIPAGGTMGIECTGVSSDGLASGLSITYTDYAGLQRAISITASSPTTGGTSCETTCNGTCPGGSACLGQDPDCDAAGSATGACCGNSRLDASEVCDGAQGVPAGAAFECDRSDCQAIKITQCATISQSKPYRLEQSISPQAGANYCISITSGAAGSKLDCKSLAGEINMQGAGPGAVGVAITNSSNITVDGCKIKLGSISDAEGMRVSGGGNNAQVLGSRVEGSGNYQDGIRAYSISSPAFNGNTVVLTGCSSNGIAVGSGIGANVSGNNLAGVNTYCSCGLALGYSSVTANPKNTCGTCNGSSANCTAACTSWGSC